MIFTGWNDPSEFCFLFYRVTQFWSEKTQFKYTMVIHRQCYAIDGLFIDLIANVGTWASPYLWWREIETIWGMMNNLQIIVFTGWNDPWGQQREDDKGHNLK